MQKLMATLLLGTALSLGVLQAAANEPALHIGNVEMIALNAEQVSKLRQERSLYAAAVELLMAMDDQTVESRLDAINNEYQRRIDSIVNNEEPAQYRRTVNTPSGVIY